MNVDKGRLGEDQACAWLASKGFSVIERNFRVRAGEIDIIALRDSEITFVEVKYRRSSLFGGAISALPQKRIERLRNAALVYISENEKYSNHKIILWLLAIQNGKVTAVELE